MTGPLSPALGAAIHVLACRCAGVGGVSAEAQSRPLPGPHRALLAAPSAGLLVDEGLGPGRGAWAFSQVHAGELSCSRQTVWAGVSGLPPI